MPQPFAGWGQHSHNHNRTWSVLFVLLLLLIAGQQAGLAQQSNARFVSVKGQVHVRPDADRRLWTSATAQTSLRVKDRIRTRPDGTAVLGFSDACTFILKSNTEIMLEPTSTRGGRIAMADGRIWVNVKKIAQDATLEIEMDLTVVRIKGTNITCSSSLGENRVKVLRGTIEAVVKATGAIMVAKTGEELIIRTGGRASKISIDVNAETAKWQEEISSIGESFEINEVPGFLQDMKRRHDEGFQKLSARAMDIINRQSADGSDLEGFRKDAERYQGSLVEDSHVLQGLYKRLARAESGPMRNVVKPIMKRISATSKGMQRYHSEVSKLLQGLGKRERNPDLENLWQEIVMLWGEVEEYAWGRPKELGLSQVYYRNAVGKLEQTAEKMTACLDRLDSVASNESDKTYATWVQKSTRGFLTAIAQAIRAYTVVEIPSEALRKMREIEEIMRGWAKAMKEFTDSYNSWAIDPHERLPASAEFVAGFIGARHVNRMADRLYTSIMRKVKVIETSEQEQFQEAYNHVVDAFNEMGEFSQQIKDRIRDIEHQLR